MLQSLRQLSIINKIFNVHGSEWPKICLIWVIRFLYRMGFVIGWTVLVAMFVGRYGIASLPYLFILIAIFTVIGTIFYSTFLERIRKETVLIWSILATVVVLFVATLLATYDIVWFFALMICAIAVFLNQIRIILNSFVEEMFLPLQSQRVFPLIEAADTFAGIAAGLLFLSLINTFDTINFIYLWIAGLFLIIPLILFSENLSEKILLIAEKRLKRQPTGLLKKIKIAFSSDKHISYIKGIFVIVFFQWILFNLLEFQYTKAVYQNVSQAIFDAGSGFEHAFVHDLGILFMLFNVSALIVQLFVGGRLINSLGVIGSMLIHPIVTLLSLFGLTWKFNFATAVLAKNNFMITSVIHTNAYHSSYYAVREDLRHHVRELLEGMVRPIGAIVGTLALIGLQKLFLGNSLIFAVNLVMVLSALLLFYFTYRQQYKYTNVVISDLYSNDSRIRMNAIDILAQKGHRGHLKHLKQLLLDENQPISIRVKILQAFTEIQPMSVLSEIIDCINSKSPIIRSAALDTLCAFRLLHHHSNAVVFAKYQLAETLKDLYKKEKNSELVSKIIKLLSCLSCVATVEFLMNVAKSKKSYHRAEALKALGRFKDPHVAEFIKPHLNSRYPREQINAAIALYAFRNFRSEANGVIDEFLQSGKNLKIALAIYALGELQLKHHRSICLNYLNSNIDSLKLNCAVALAKMGSYETIPVLVNMLFSHNTGLSQKVKFELKNLDVRFSRNIDKIVKDLVEFEVEDLMQKKNADSLMELDKDSLTNLHRLYALVEEYEEVELIENILSFNKT